MGNARSHSPFEQSLRVLDDRDPYEAARTQMEWARSLRASGQLEPSSALLQAARATFERLGAQRDLAEAENTLD